MVRCLPFSLNWLFFHHFEGVKQPVTLSKEIKGSSDGQRSLSQTFEAQNSSDSLAERIGVTGIRGAQGVQV